MSDKPLLKVVRTQLHQMIDQYLDQLEKRIEQKQKVRRRRERAVVEQPDVTKPKPAPEAVEQQEVPSIEPQATEEPELQNFFASLSQD